MVNSNNFEVRSKTEKGAAPSWLLSFGDLTAILTTFFVLLFSMSTPQSEKWQEFVPGLALSKSGLEREEPIPGKNVAPLIREHAPALPLRGRIDVVGAGDSVTANVAVALAAGSTTAEACHIAMAAASHTIHQIGTTGFASVDDICALL